MHGLALLPQLHTGGFATSKRCDINRLAIEADLSAAGITQAQFERRLAGQLKELSFALERTEQHLAVGIGQLSPAISAELDLNQRLASRHCPSVLLILCAPR